jgi:hypothetical protein
MLRSGRQSDLALVHHPRSLPMDADRLDILARALATSGRRTLLRLLGGGALGLAGWQRVGDANPVAARNCKKIKNKQKRKKCKKKGKEPSKIPVPVLIYQCRVSDPGIAENFSNTRFAQVFTAAQSGSLHQIQFDVIKDAGSTGDYVVQLLAVGADGKPNNTVLAHAIVPNASVPDGPATLTANFGGPPLVAGLAYASAINRSGANFSTAVITGARCAGQGFSQSPIETGAFTAFSSDLITAVTVLA